jgi:hypothetical protein
MDQEFYKRFAQRARDLAEKADPFTRRRLLDLAAGYDAKGGQPSAASRSMERRMPRTASSLSGRGEA